VRPTTGQTLYLEDMVGQVFDDTDRPIATKCWHTGDIVQGPALITEPVPAGMPVREQELCVPVVHQGHPVAVLSRDAQATALRRLGELERVYHGIFDRFARMIANGSFPFGGDEAEPEDSPRVGDGCILVGDDARVRYTSPNAMSALHRLGIHANVRDLLLAEVGFDDTAVHKALALRAPVIEEIERGDTSLVVRAIPILEGAQPDGAVVLVRDVSELRRRDRMLVSKDATIREIHHRVKNNLQTIASLLRLQSRRLGSDEAKLALEESTRRIRAIALVHETLSRASGEVVPFDDVVRPLVRLLEEALTAPERAVRFTVEGHAGEVSAEVATPLAVVLNEVMQNAVDHGFPASWADAEEAHVLLRIRRTDRALDIEVIDNGAGLPEGFTLGHATGLGLSIVQTLVTTELNGSIELRNAEPSGTRVHVRVPLRLADE
jgi:two-component sensor histidine kinase